MLRRYWLLLVLLLPFLALFGAGVGAGFVGGTQADCRYSTAAYPDDDCIVDRPFDQRHAIVSDASESADEEGPPAKIFAIPAVLWSNEPVAGGDLEIPPGFIGAAPISHAARPRAPPHSL